MSPVEMALNLWTALLWVLGVLCSFIGIGIVGIAALIGCGYLLCYLVACIEDACIWFKRKVKRG